MIITKAYNKRENGTIKEDYVLYDEKCLIERQEMLYIRFLYPDKNEKRIESVVAV